MEDHKPESQTTTRNDLASIGTYNDCHEPGAGVVELVHPFAGMVDTTAFPGDTLDIRPVLNPTYCRDIPDGFTARKRPRHSVSRMISRWPGCHQRHALSILAFVILTVSLVIFMRIVPPDLTGH